MQWIQKTSEDWTGFPYGIELKILKKLSTFKGARFVYICFQGHLLQIFLAQNLFQPQHLPLPSSLSRSGAHDDKPVDPAPT